MQAYLQRFLRSGDATFQHIAIWTILQLLESEDKRLIGLMGQSAEIVEQLRAAAQRHVDPDEDEEADDDDEGEAVGLAQRCLELLGLSVSKAHIEA